RIADAALAPDDGVVLLDTVRGGIMPIDPSGAPLPFEPLDPPPQEPASIAVDAGGRRYALESNGRLRVLERGGRLVADQVAPGMTAAGSLRTVITVDHVLCAADPSRGKVWRWRIEAGGREDEKR